MTSPHDWTAADNRDEDYAIKAFVTPSEYYNDISLAFSVIVL